ncbi:plasmid partition protein ParG [Novosphingobium sp. MW5]|nr:plasmid partition protein ParG [Novosphingobium sp. MW5]
MAADSNKPLASLTPTLLARKGGAKPAMRVHSAAAAINGDAELTAIDHDLGWNDMGESHQAEVVPITRTADARRQQQHLARELARENRERQSAFARGRKAAFTLRLDEERHLRLRLACTAQNLSAQAVVTQALDKFLADNPELEGIAGQLRAKRK